MYVGEDNLMVQVWRWTLVALAAAPVVPDGLFTLPARPGPGGVVGIAASYQPGPAQG